MFKQGARGGKIARLLGHYSQSPRHCRQILVSSARVVVGVDGDVPLIVLRGEFDMSTTVDLRIALKGASVAHETIIVDLTDTTFLDSTAVSALAITAGRKRLRIRGATGVIRRILEATGVIKFMEDEG
jgi:anti-anti-sigma factor